MNHDYKIKIQVPRQLAAECCLMGNPLIEMPPEVKDILEVTDVGLIFKRGSNPNLITGTEKVYNKLSKTELANIHKYSEPEAIYYYYKDKEGKFKRLFCVY